MQNCGRTRHHDYRRRYCFLGNSPLLSRGKGLFTFRCSICQRGFARQVG